MTSITQKNLRGSRLPPEWTPTSEFWNYATSLGFDANTIARIAEDFHDFWCSVPGQRGLKISWFLTWKTWCRREADKRRPSGYQPPHGRATAIEIAAELSLGLRAR